MESDRSGSLSVSYSNAVCVSTVWFVWLTFPASPSPQPSPASSAISAEELVSV